MEIFKKESKLFSEWSKSRDDFVSDGVVSEKDYITSELKLCFILKEVNDEGGGGWDLREFIKEGACGKTWNNITRWVICIDKIGTDIPWSSLESIDKTQRTELLLPICAMNLKKSPGGSTTNQTEFEDVVEEDQSFIRQQYNIYKPNLTICCGTGWDFRYALGLNDGEIFETSNGIEWFRNHDLNPVVVYKHPQAWIKGSTLTYELVNAIREVLA
jgi:hypothetical protein